MSNTSKLVFAGRKTSADQTATPTYSVCLAIWLAYGRARFCSPGYRELPAGPYIGSFAFLKLPTGS
jgi:hypothetical protein